jgi:hypothetical protein
MSAVIRDIAIILLAIQTLIVNILLAILIWQVWRMVKMMQGEVKPIIEDTQDTLGTVRGTANFVGMNVVDPVVRTSRTVAGSRAAFKSLTADLFPRRSHRSRQTGESVASPPAGPPTAPPSSSPPVTTSPLSPPPSPPAN